MALGTPSPALMNDATAEAKSGQTHGSTGLTLPGYEDTGLPLIRLVNRLLWTMQTYIRNPGVVVDEGGLNVGVYGLQYVFNGVAKTLADHTAIGLVDNDDNYVWCDTDAVVETGLAWPGGEHIRLAIVTTLGGDITVVSQRLEENFGRGDGSGWSGLIASADVDMGNFDLTNVDQFKMKLAGTAPAAEGQIAWDTASKTLRLHNGTALKALFDLNQILAAVNGGTGLATLTDRSVVLGRGTAAVNFAVPATTGIPLVSQGPAANPAFVALDLADVNAVKVGGALPVIVGGTGSIIAKNIPWQASVFEAGVIGTGLLKGQIWLPDNVQLVRVAANLATAGAGGAATVIDCLDDGGSIHGVAGDRATIAAGATQALSAVEAHEAASGSWITFNVTGVDTGSPADLTMIATGYTVPR